MDSDDGAIKSNLMLAVPTLLGHLKPSRQVDYALIIYFKATQIDAGTGSLRFWDYFRSSRRTRWRTHARDGQQAARMAGTTIHEVIDRKNEMSSPMPKPGMPK